MAPGAVGFSNAPVFIYIVCMNIQQNIPLAPRTTINLGGSAQYYASCTSNEDITDALAWASQHSQRVHVLGGGSNTIFADEGFDGLIIHIQTKGIEVSDDGLLTVQAGEDWDAVVQYAITHGLAGIECLSGIPGSAGATPFQNVGAYGQEVAETIVRVDAIDRVTQKRISCTNAECAFAYRTSRFKETDRDRYVITSVSFQLDPSGVPAAKYPELQGLLKDVPITPGTEGLRKTREAVLQLRKKKSMVIDPQDPNSVSCGSFFTNPIIPIAQYMEMQKGSTDSIPHYPAGSRDDGTPLTKLSAAWLVEHAGFSKGTRRGNVGISDTHSLALVNRGGTTYEIISLAEEVQENVRMKFGVTLALEPIVVR